MGVTIAESLVECAPGNEVSLAGTDLTGTTHVVFGNQLFVPTDGTATSLTGLVTVAATASFATLVSFTVPDGVTSGPLTITAGDLSQTTVQMRVVSQYVQSAEYIAEGVDTSDLAAGELDQVL